MSFTTTIFLFIFLPLTLAGYYLIQKRLRNVFLFLASIVFYAWGSVSFLGLLLSSILVNYGLARLLERVRGKKFISGFFTFAMLAWNFGLLFYFKYLIFTLESINGFTGMALPLPSIVLPLGISFFTFKAVSYGLEVHWGTMPAQKNLFDVALYISFFPQISMGPIADYGSFEKQLKNREFSVSMFSAGAQRFVVGLGKKVILANTLGILVDRAFSLPPNERSVLLAWMGIIGYLLQLYFDFSGYSDMAIGLGKMFGFETPENFNYPYCSKSVVEYWGRWHITLGTWLKKYLYTPVFRGLMERKNPFTKTIFSIHQCDIVALFVTWMFAGIWHGAGWTFLIYGFYYFLLIAMERVVEYHQKKRRKKLGVKKTPDTKLRSSISHFYLLIAVLGGTLIFRSNDVGTLSGYIASLFGAASNPLTNMASGFLFWDNLVLFAVSIVAAVPLLKWMAAKLPAKLRQVMPYLSMVAMVALFVVSLSYVVNSAYDPFIYGNF